MGIFQNLTGWHAIIILAVILLLFGAAKLPALARSAGQSLKIFKTEIADASAPGTTTSTAATHPAATHAAAGEAAAGLAENSGAVASAPVVEKR